MINSSSSGTLQFLSASSSLQSGTDATSNSTASANKTTSTTTSSSANNATTVPQSVITALDSYVSPTVQAWNTLSQSLKTGNISAAQTALTAYTSALSAATGTMSAPSQNFLNDLTSLASSLQQGDLTGARTAFTYAQGDAPSTADQDVYWAQSAADLDGWIDVYALQHAQGIDTSELAADISGVDSALREEGAYITSALVAQGYQAAKASNYASEITGINLGGSAQDNDAVDTTRANQWIQSIISIGQGGTASTQYSDLQAPNEKNTEASISEGLISEELSTVLYSKATESGKMLQSLINHTLGTASPDSTNPSTSS